MDDLNELVDAITDIKEELNAQIVKYTVDVIKNNDNKKLLQLIGSVPQGHKLSAFLIELRKYMKD